MRKFLLGLSLWIVAASVLAGELSGLTDFTSGTAISSSDVNANFAEIETQVTDNASDITALEAIDTVAEMETAEGVNVLLETEIDASSELRAIMDDESGTGALLFADGDIGDATGTSLTLDANATASAVFTSDTGSDQAKIQLADGGSTTRLDFYVDDANGDDQRYLAIDGASETITAYKDFVVSGGGVSINQVSATNGAGGLLTCGYSTLVTAAGNQVINCDCSADNIGATVRVVMQDANEKAEIAPIPTSGETIVANGISPVLDAEDELGLTSTTAGASIELVCLAVDTWYVTRYQGTINDEGTYE